MRSAKSYFNGTLFKKNLTRFWPIWGAYLIIWLFAFPVQLILDGDYGVNHVTRFVNRTVLEYIVELGLPMAVIFALLAAVAVWSYLFNNRSTCLMHTLPIRREGLFLTNFLFGMTFMAAPNLIVFVLTLLVELTAGTVDVGALVMWFFAVTLMELFFFCLATFCAMCTGHILGLPALYGVFNILAVGVTALVDLALERFMFGYTGAEQFSTLTSWLTPVWKLADNLEVRRDLMNGSFVDETAWQSGFGYVLIYVILGLILALCALALYRRRHMERAGDVITVSWMRPIFQYGVAFCCALAFGTLLFEFFSSELPETAWTLLVFMLICGAVGYFIAKMLLEKSFRVFRCWKGCLPLLAALIVLVCVVEFDLTGYERRVPDVEDVKSVYISGDSTPPHDEAGWMSTRNEENGVDPEIIRAALDIHRTIVENKEFLEENQNRAYQYEDLPEGYSAEIRSCKSFHVDYTLKDGTVISRDYDGLPVSVEDLKNPETLTAKLDALANLPQMIEAAYGLSDEKAEDIIEMTLSSYYVRDGYDGYEDIAISKDAYEKVFEAVMADFAEGNIGRRYLMDDEERMNNCFTNDLDIVFYRGKAEEKTQLEASGMVVAATNPMPTTEPDVITDRITVTLQTTSRHTIAALSELGVLKQPVELMTQAQRGMANHARNEAEKNGENVNLADFVWDTIGE